MINGLASPFLALLQHEDRNEPTLGFDLHGRSTRLLYYSLFHHFGRYESSQADFQGMLSP